MSMNIKLNSDELDTIKVSLETSIIQNIEKHIELTENPQYDGYSLYYAKDCFNILSKLVKNISDIGGKVLNLALLYELVEEGPIKEKVEKALYEERADEMPF